ncbi:MAG: NYN domain-containing protein [Ktedonobacteraceae bacterium]|nr:NYN domain-containing protein [Ktedonobacteraceae bacterium]
MSRIGTFLLRHLRLLLTRRPGLVIFPMAVLIDGDNHTDMSSEVLAQVLVQAGQWGHVTIRRVYGNWRAPTMDRWQSLCLHYGLESLHLMQLTALGKNAADIALAVDALDLLRCHGIRHFCLVVNDSDYLPLVQRLRAAGCMVMVIGKSTTLPALVKACTVFIPLDQLMFTPSKPVKTVPSHPVSGSEAPSTLPPSPVLATARAEAKPESETPLRTLLLRAYKQAAQGKEDGWVSIQGFHGALMRLDSSFKPSAYHYKNFAALFQAHAEVFETRKQPSGHLAIRMRLER